MQQINIRVNEFLNESLFWPCFLDSIRSQVYYRLRLPLSTMDKLPVTKFDETEFGLWKYQMSIYFEYHGLFNVVSGKDRRPQTNPEDWDTTEKKAKYILTQSLELLQVRHIINCKTSNEIWSRLETLYEQKN